MERGLGRRPGRTEGRYRSDDVGTPAIGSRVIEISKPDLVSPSPVRQRLPGKGNAAGPRQHPSGHQVRREHQQKTSLDEAFKTLYATTKVHGLDGLSLSRKGRVDVPRELLNHVVLRKVWTQELNGKLTTWRANSATGKRQANSPAVKFLIAALRPLFVVGPERAEKIIEAERKQPDPKLGPRFFKIIDSLAR
jgi:hypothetical protein